VALINRSRKHACTKLSEIFTLYFSEQLSLITLRRASLFCCRSCTQFNFW